MKNTEWKDVMNKRKRRRRMQNLLLILILLSAIGSAVWYFFFYTRTPDYTVKQALAAIEERDKEKFCKYVNLEVLTSKAYDDLTLDLFAYDATLTPKTKVLFEKFYVLVKPELTAGSSDTILNRIDSGVWSLPTGTNLLKGRQLGIDFERFLERSQIRNTTLVKFDGITYEGRTAIAHLAIKEDYTQTEFTLELAMEEDADGHWQITYIKNYKAYLNTVAPLQNKDIAEYIEATQDIVDKYNATFDDQQSRFKALMDSMDGAPSEAQGVLVTDLLEDEVIPALKKRQKKLDEVKVPEGAAYLARLRQQSTEATIKTWQHFIKALHTGSHKEYETAETLHKQQLEIDLRIEDIIKHTAVSKNIPNLP